MLSAAKTKPNFHEYKLQQKSVFLLKSWNIFQFSMLVPPCQVPILQQGLLQRCLDGITFGGTFAVEVTSDSQNRTRAVSWVLFVSFGTPRITEMLNWMVMKRSYSNCVVVALAVNFWAFQTQWDAPRYQGFVMEKPLEGAKESLAPANQNDCCSRGWDFVHVWTFADFFPTKTVRTIVKTEVETEKAGRVWYRKMFDMNCRIKDQELLR